MAWGKNNNWKWQLRDSKGRWIEMGRGVKWYSPALGREVAGTVVGQKGKNAIVDLTSEPNDPRTGKPQQVSVKGSDIEVIANKATLNPTANKAINNTDEMLRQGQRRATVPSTVDAKASPNEKSVEDKLDALEDVTVRADDAELSGDNLKKALDGAKFTVPGAKGNYTVSAGKDENKEWNFLVTDDKGAGVENIPMGVDDTKDVVGKIDKAIKDHEKAAGSEEEGSQESDAPADTNYNDAGLTEDEQKLADGYDRMAERADKAGNFDAADRYRAQKDALTKTGQDRLAGGDAGTKATLPEEAPEEAPEAPEEVSEAPEAEEEAPAPAEAPEAPEEAPEAEEAETPEPGAGKPTLFSATVRGGTRSELEFFDESARESGVDQGYRMNNGKFEVYDVKRALRSIDDARDIELDKSETEYEAADKRKAKAAVKGLNALEEKLRAYEKEATQRERETNKAADGEQDELPIPGIDKAADNTDKHLETLDGLETGDRVSNTNAQGETSTYQKHEDGTWDLLDPEDAEEDQDPLQEGLTSEQIASLHRRGELEVSTAADREEAERAGLAEREAGGDYLRNNPTPQRNPNIDRTQPAGPTRAEQDAADANSADEPWNAKEISSSMRNWADIAQAFKNGDAGARETMERAASDDEDENEAFIVANDKKEPFDVKLTLNDAGEPVVQLGDFYNGSKSLGEIPIDGSTSTDDIADKIHKAINSDDPAASLAESNGSAASSADSGSDSGSDSDEGTADSSDSAEETEEADSSEGTEADEDEAPAPAPVAAPATDEAPEAAPAVPAPAPLSAEDQLAAAGVERTEPVALEGEKFAPTRQQQDIIDAVMAGKNVAVQALAGSGKTSTLEALAKRIALQFPEKNIAYVAFNRSVRIEASTRMPKNVEAKTQHGLAHKWAPKWMKDRTDKKKNKGALWNATAVAGHLGLRETVRDGDGPPLAAKDIAAAALRTVDTFANSAEERPDASHLPEKIKAMGPKSQAAVLDAAQKVWEDASKPDGQIRFTLDYMRKHWALTKPDLSKGSGLSRPVDIIFMDEAQDTPEVMAALMDHQSAQMVVVGDSNQNIYSSFTGSIDYMSRVGKDVELPLTKSWRFGPEVADIGNRFLELGRASTRVEGGGSSKIVDGMQDPDAILVRSNGGMFGEIFAELQKGRTVGVPSGTKEDMLSLVNTAAWLRNGGDAPREIHQDLAPYTSWQEVVDGADEGDSKLTKVVNMVNTHGIPKLRNMLNEVVERGTGVDLVGFTLVTSKGDSNVSFAEGNTFGNNAAQYLRQAGFRLGFIPGAEPFKTGPRKGKPRDGWIITGTDEERKAAFQRAQDLADGGAVDVMVSTVHKSKGLEWNRVRIGDDFRGPELNQETGEYDMPSPEELRVAYVAVTRAQKELDPGSLGYVFDHTQENGGLPEAPEVPGEADAAADRAEADHTLPEGPDETGAPDPEAEQDGPGNLPEDDASREEADLINNEPEEESPVAEELPSGGEAPEEPVAVRPYETRPMADFTDEEFAELPVGTRFPRTRPGGSYVKVGPNEWEQWSRHLVKIGGEDRTFTDAEIRDAEGIEPAAVSEPAPEAPSVPEEEAEATPEEAPLAEVGPNGESPLSDEEREPEPEPEDVVPDPEVVPEPAPLPTKETTPAPAPAAPEETPAPAAEGTPRGGTELPDPDQRPLHPVKVKAANYPDGTIIRSSRTGEAIQKTNGNWHVAGRPETAADPMDIDSPYVYDMPKQPDDSFDAFEGLEGVVPGDIIMTRKGTQAAVVRIDNGKLIVAAHNQSDEQRRLRPTLHRIDPVTVKGINKFENAPAGQTSQSGQGTRSGQGGQTPPKARPRTPFSSNRGNTNLAIKDVSGNEVKIGDTVRTDMGTGRVARVRPSDGPYGSVSVEFEDGLVKQFRGNRIRNTAFAEEVSGDDPSKMEIGSMGESGDGRKFMVGKGNKPIFKGDEVALADGTVGKVSGFAKGVQSINIRVEGRATDVRKKASVVDAVNYTAPETTSSENESAPAPEPEAPPASEPDAPTRGRYDVSDNPISKEFVATLEEVGLTPEKLDDLVNKAGTTMKHFVSGDDALDVLLSGTGTPKQNFDAAQTMQIVVGSLKIRADYAPTGSEDKEMLENLDTGIWAFKEGTERKWLNSLNRIRTKKDAVPLKGSELDNYSGNVDFSGFDFATSRFNPISPEGLKSNDPDDLIPGTQIRPGVRVTDKDGNHLGIVAQTSSARSGSSKSVRITSHTTDTTYGENPSRSMPIDAIKVADVKWNTTTDLTFDDTTDKAEITSRMSSAYPGIAFEFGGVDLQQAREFAASTSKMLNKYPMLQQNMVSIATANAGESGTLAYVQRDTTGFADPSYAPNRMVYNTKGTNAYGHEEVVKSVRGMVESGYQIHADHGDEVASTVIHEFGHALDNLTGKINELDLMDVISEVWGSDAEDVQNIGDKLRRQKQLSGYSTINGRLNTAELVAESFADVELNGTKALPLSKHIHAELMRRLAEPDGLDPHANASAPATFALAEEMQSSFSNGGFTMTGALPGGNSGAVILKGTLPNGREVVMKTQGGDSANKEYLASRVLNTLGVDNVATVKVNDDTSMTNFVNGKSGLEWMNESDFNTPVEMRDAMTKLKNSREVGLFDFITSNQDRHAGNWLLSDDGSVAPIDHGGTVYKAWSPKNDGRYLFAEGKFAQASLGVTMDSDTYITQVDASVSWTKDELEGIRTKVAGLASDYAEHPDWHKFMLDRIDYLLEGTPWQ